MTLAQEAPMSINSTKTIQQELSFAINKYNRPSAVIVLGLLISRTYSRDLNSVLKSIPTSYDVKLIIGKK